MEPLHQSAMATTLGDRIGERAAEGREPAVRIQSIDIVRGAVMVLMAIDHVRVYSGLPAGSAEAGLFFTRWITHFCAPGFAFLAGTAAFLYGRKLADTQALARYLVKRGLLLVLLELTVIRLAWTFNFNYRQFTLAGVIWMLGWCMVLLAGMVRLPGQSCRGDRTGHYLFPANLSLSAALAARATPKLGGLDLGVRVSRRPGEPVGHSRPLRSGSVDRRNGSRVWLRPDLDARTLRTPSALPDNRLVGYRDFSSDRQPRSFLEPRTRECSSATIPPLEPTKISGLAALLDDDAWSYDCASAAGRTRSGLVRRSTGDNRPRTDVLLSAAHPVDSRRGAFRDAHSRRTPPPRVVCDRTLHVRAAGTQMGAADVVPGVGDCRCDSLSAVPLVRGREGAPPRGLVEVHLKPKKIFAGVRTFRQEPSSKPLTNVMLRNEARYTIRPTGESSVAVQVFKSGLMARRKHILFLEHYRGEVEYDHEHPEKSRVELVFEANSVVCRDQWLSPEKRRGLLAFVQKEVLAADRHGQIAFSSERVERKSPTRFELAGTLSIRGSSRPVVFEVIVLPNGKDRLEIDGTARVKLSDYGIDRPSSFFGLVGTKDEISLRFLLWPERGAAIERNLKSASG